ncbi:MAG: DUF4198 domain-containing protein [Opitutaceae bacterium]
MFLHFLRHGRLARAVVILATSGLQPGLLHAHDTFFRVDDYQVDAGDTVEVRVFHGTFDESVMRIETAHVERLFLAGPKGESDIGTSGWKQEGFGSRPWGKWQALRAWAGAIDERLTSHFEVTLPQEGSYMIAMSLEPAGAAMAPEVFNKYLAEQGLQNEPVARHGIINPNAIITERWRKYVKLLLQAGDERTANVTEPAGLVVEFVPLTHPAETKAGETLEFQLLLRGQPLAGQPVVAGREKPAFGDAPPHVFLRSNAGGRVSVPIDDSGVWWLSFTHIARAHPRDEMMWNSHWATLTFEIP